MEQRRADAASQLKRDEQAALAANAEKKKAEIRGSAN